MKRKVIFHFHTIVIALVLAVLCSSRFGKIFTSAIAPGHGMPDFNEMFKNFDFEKFVAELDEQLAGIEEEEKLAAIQKPATPANSYAPVPVKNPAIAQPANYSSADSKRDALADISEDPEELILNPPIVKIAKTGIESSKSNVVNQLPHKESEKALSHYVQDIIDCLQKVDQASLSSHGEEFHEQYLNACSDKTIELVVSLRMLLSKRAYRVAVLAPPKELEATLRSYRKNILSVRHKLMKLVKELAVTEKQELSEEERMRKKLEALAQVSTLQTTAHEPIKKPTPKAHNDDDKDNITGDDDEEDAKTAALTKRAKTEPVEFSDDEEELYNDDDFQNHYIPPKQSQRLPQKAYPSALEKTGIIDQYQSTYGNNEEEIA
ncbi:hypothetical protein FJ365_05680 [Candidatus Dependentiae bacterium]|nr:hypothetical protein [Candidatus Dependentiae bacterium]